MQKLNGFRLNFCIFCLRSVCFMGIKLSKLFYNCTHILYTTVGECGDYAIRRCGNTLFIYFQGSNGKIDWKNNLDFPAKPYKRMGKIVWLCHRGFLKVWKSMEGSIGRYISDTSLEKIYICGYSHGGALATLCYEYVWYNRKDLRGNIFGFGFGAPRVLWGLRFKSITSRWRDFTVIRNLDDLVTHVPPFLFGYFHVGTLLKIGKRGQYSKIDAHRDNNLLCSLLEYEKGRQIADPTNICY